MIWWYCATVGKFCKTLRSLSMSSRVGVLFFPLASSLSLSFALSPSNNNSICLTPPPFLTLSLTLRVSLPLCLRWMPFLFLVACVLCCLSVYYFDYYVFCVWMFRMNVCVLFARASFIEAPGISLTEICYWCAFPHTQQPKTHIKSG